MNKRLFKKGDEVILISGRFLYQLSRWENKKALVSRDENPDEDGNYIFIESGNFYSNSYPRNDLKLIKPTKNKTTNKDFIKKHKRKDFTTTYLIQSFILITKDNQRQ